MAASCSNRPITPASASALERSSVSRCRAAEGGTVSVCGARTLGCEYSLGVTYAS